jgi:hypothetical protein
MDIVGDDRSSSTDSMGVFCEHDVESFSNNLSHPSACLRQGVIPLLASFEISYSIDYRVTSIRELTESGTVSAK